MILYDFPGAPNPRRVLIFAAEKGIDLNRVTIDLAKREQRSDAMLAKNPSGKIPVLELDDGRCIGESVAICRYLEHVVPEPNLFGAPGFEAAEVEMHHRHIELELFSQVGTAWVNGPIVASMGLIEPIEAARARAHDLVLAYYRRLDKALATRPYMAGERFTIADITALCCIDFAAKLVNLKPGEELTKLWQWHARVSERPSVAAYPA